LQLALLFNLTRNNLEVNGLINANKNKAIQLIRYSENRNIAYDSRV